MDLKVYFYKKEYRTPHNINKYRTHIKINFPHTKLVWYNKTHENKHFLYLRPVVENNHRNNQF